MRTVREIVLPGTKPETEWIADRPVQKVSPTRKHSVLQLAFADALKAWAKADDRGQVGTEWRFRASPPDEDVHPLVPDVAYMSYTRLQPLSAKDREVPPVPPQIVVEIFSPDDRPRDVDEKRRVYFAGGVTPEIIADPDARTVDFYDSVEHFERVDATVEAYTPASVPSLTLSLRAIFAEMDIPEQLGGANDDDALRISNPGRADGAATPRLRRLTDLIEELVAELTAAMDRLKTKFRSDPQFRGGSGELN